MLSFVGMNLFSQNKFSILGRTNFVKEGKAVLSEIAFREFYSCKTENDTVFIHSNEFQFTGKLNYPEQFRLIVFDSLKSYISEPFFLDSGEQKISFDSNAIVNRKYDIGYGILLENSEANNEYINQYLPLFNSLNKRVETYLTKLDNCDSLSKELKKQCFKSAEIELYLIRKMRDSLFNQYSIQNPSSAIMPWILYEAIKKYGYKDVYQNIFDRIAKFNNSYINNRTLLFLKEQKLKSIGNTFPLLEYINFNQPGVINKNQYTLIEFWFSGCSPCIAQFNQLKPIYKKFNKKGFEIIGISTDPEAYASKLKKIIEKFNFSWKQILDKGGLESSKINIEKYPSSFLLDKYGNIVFIDITVYDLGVFLSKKIY